MNLKESCIFCFQTPWNSFPTRTHARVFLKSNSELTGKNLLFGNKIGDKSKSNRKICFQVRGDEWLDAGRRVRGVDRMDKQVVEEARTAVCRKAFCRRQGANQIVNVNVFDRFDL